MPRSLRALALLALLAGVVLGTALLERTRNSRESNPNKTHRTTLFVPPSRWQVCTFENGRRLCRTHRADAAALAELEAICRKIRKQVRHTAEEGRVVIVDTRCA